MDKVCVNNGRSDDASELHSPSWIWNSLPGTQLHFPAGWFWIGAFIYFLNLFLYFCQTALRVMHYLINTGNAENVTATRRKSADLSGFELLPRAASDLCTVLKVYIIFTSVIYMFRHSVNVYKKLSRRLPTGTSGRPGHVLKTRLVILPGFLFLF